MLWWKRLDALGLGRHDERTRALIAHFVMTVTTFLVIGSSPSRLQR